MTRRPDPVTVTQQAYAEGGFPALREMGFSLYVAQPDAKGIPQVQARAGGVAWQGRSASTAELASAQFVGIARDGAKLMLDVATGKIAPAVLYGGPTPTARKAKPEAKAPAAPEKPKPPSEATARRALQKTLAAYGEAEKAHQAAAANVARIQRGIIEAEGLREQTKDRIARAVAEAVAKDAELPRLEKQRAKIREAEETRAGFADALPLAQASEAEAKAALSAALEALEDAVFDLDAALAAKARERLKAAGAAFIAPLAELAALDTVRLRLLGERPSLDPRRHAPVGGVNIARRFIEALPEEMRPAALNIAATEANAAKLAREILTELLEQPQ